MLFFSSEALLTQDRDLLVPSSASVPYLLLLFFSAPIFLLLHLVTQLFQEIQSRGKTQLNYGKPVICRILKSCKNLNVTILYHKNQGYVSTLQHVAKFVTFLEMDVVSNRRRQPSIFRSTADPPQTLSNLVLFHTLQAPVQPNCPVRNEEKSRWTSWAIVFASFWVHLDVGFVVLQQEI